MNAKAWVLAAVTLSWAAGAVLGVAVCRGAAQAERDQAELPSVDREFLQRFTEEFVLSGDQVKVLGAILRRRVRDETSIYRQNVSSLPPTVQEKLGGARRAADKRIELMLDPPQRARYELLRQAQDSKR